MPPLRRQSVSVLGHDETRRAEAAQSQARNAHRPPKMNEAEPATHPTAYFPTRPTRPTPPRRNRARSTAPRQRNRALPAGQGGVGFPERPSAVFHVEGEPRKANVKAAHPTSTRRKGARHEQSQKNQRRSRQSRSAKRPWSGSTSSSTSSTATYASRAGRFSRRRSGPPPLAASCGRNRSSRKPSTTFATRPSSRSSRVPRAATRASRKSS